MTNNFNLLAEKLVWEDDKDKYYFILLIQRRKDNPGLENYQNIVHTYSITKKETFLKLEPEIVKLCDSFNARAYIYPNRRSYENTALVMIETLIKSIRFKNYSDCKKTYTSCSGSYASEENKKWIIDLDKKAEDCTDLLEVIDSIKNIITPLYPKNEEKILYSVPSKTGLHLISMPFDLAKGEKELKDLEKQLNGWEIEIHKDGMTNLYIP